MKSLARVVIVAVFTIEDYTQSLQLNPNDPKAYCNRAVVHFKLDNYRGAIEDYTQSLQLNPNDPTVYINRGHALSKLKDYNAAIEDYKKARQVSNRMIQRVKHSPRLKS